MVSLIQDYTTFMFSARPQYKLLIQNSCFPLCCKVLTRTSVCGHESLREDFRNVFWSVEGLTLQDCVCFHSGTACSHDDRRNSGCTDLSSFSKSFHAFSSIIWNLNSLHFAFFLDLYLLFCQSTQLFVTFHQVLMIGLNNIYSVCSLSFNIFFNLCYSPCFTFPGPYKMNHTFKV